MDCVLFVAIAVIFAIGLALRARWRRRPSEELRLLDTPFPATLRVGETSGEPRLRFLEFACSVPYVPAQVRIAGPEWRLDPPPWSRTPRRVPGWDAYVIFATDGEALFAPPAHAMVRNLDSLHSGAVLIDVSGGGLRIRDTALPMEADREASFVRAAYALAELVRERLAPSPPAPIVEISEQPALTVAAGMCLVCGTEMRERRVECGRCRTPHHKECWDYNGECATYACGSTRTTAGGVRTIPGPPFPATLRTGQTSGEDPVAYIEFECAMPYADVHLRVNGSEWNTYAQPGALPTTVYGWSGYDVYAHRGSTALLAPPVRHLVGEIDRLHEGSIVVELLQGRLRVRDIVRAGEADRESEFVQASYALAAQLRDRLSQQAVGVRLIEEPEPTCPVCRTMMRERRDCDRCRTPHHPECWNFNGGCSCRRVESRDRRATHGTCPACMSGVRVDPRVCDRCGGVSHAECWNRVGCASLRCRGRSD